MNINDFILVAACRPLKKKERKHHPKTITFLKAFSKVIEQEQHLTGTQQEDIMIIKSQEFLI